MNNFDFKKLIPHAIAYLGFVLVSFLLFSPMVFNGKVLNQGDVTRAKGMAREITEIKKETGEAPLWTNSQFAGMPSYQIHQTIDGNYLKPVNKVLLLGQGMVSSEFVVILAMFCCYLLLLVLKVDWKLAAFGAAFYGISSYHIDLIEAGHATKMLTFALLPALYIGPILAFRGKLLLGGGLFALFTGLHIYANHIQITYYAFIMLAILGIIELVRHAKSGAIAKFGKAAGVLVIAAVLGVASNTSKLWPTYEYAEVSQRGKSELSSAKGSGGLSKDYIWEWSYGISETMTLLVPQFMGGGASQSHEGTRTYDVFYQNFLQQGYPREVAKSNANRQTGTILYHGDQRFVGMGIYFGAIMCFLFVLGAFLVKSNIKWWLVISAALAISFAWGGNFFLNDLLVDYFPLFDKFRAVSMALGLAQLAFVALGILGIQKLMDKDTLVADKQKALYIASGVTGGLCLIAMILSGGMDLSGANDANFQNIIGVIKEDRAALIRSDAIRSLVLILIGAGLVWAYLKGKVTGSILVLGIGVFMVGEMFQFDKRYLYSEKFEEPRVATANTQPRPVDNQIKADTDPHYRVLDLAGGNPFVNVMTSYHHKSIGGYHSAKLKIFQEFIENYPLSQDNMDLYGMLNAKYIIQGEGAEATASRNPQALGNAWFVQDYQVVDNADQELAALATVNPAQQAIIQKKYAAPVEGQQFAVDSSATIRLTSYHPDKMVYEYSANSPQLTLFSEVYYPTELGWGLYLDGNEEIPMTKANYLLRTAVLPAGQHTLEMRFEPRSFLLGENISRIASILSLLMFFGGVVLFFRNNGIPEVDRIQDIEPAKALVRKKAKATVSKKGRNKGKKKK